MEPDPKPMLAKAQFHLLISLGRGRLTKPHNSTTWTSRSWRCRKTSDVFRPELSGIESSTKMPEHTRKARQPQAILKEARSLLLSVTLKDSTQSHVHSVERGDSSEKIFDSTNQQNATNAGRSLLLHCGSLVEEFQRLSLAEFQFEFKDWTVVKAVVELLVRWGIYPYLSPGVGIPLQKRFGEKAVAALSDNLLHVSGPVSLEGSDGAVKTHPLVLSAELLASILLENPGKNIDRNSSGMKDDHSNSETKEEEKVDGSRSTEEEVDPGFSSPTMALHQLVLSHHLVDVLAALLQAAYGASLTSTSLQASEISKKNAVENIRLLIEKLPAAHLVEALFILLGEAEGLTPPLWLKPEVGKLLSLAVMHDGGIAAVMERLVGSAAKGSVHVYERVATQLARVPRSVASKDHYYKGVCMQLQPLLVLPQSHSKFGSSGDIAQRLVSNMHHTSILLACTLAQQDPVLVERYFTRPIVKPLLDWGALHSQSEAVENKAAVSSERVVVHSLLKIQVLITAGHKGSLHLREQLLQLTSPIAPKLMLLNYLLWPSYANHDREELGKKLNQVKTSGEQNPGRQIEDNGDPQKGFSRGFLIDRSLSTSSSSGEDLGGPVAQFVSAISDIVQAHLSQNVNLALPIVSTFLFSLDTSSLEWPTADGEISDALRAGREQPDSSVVFLAKLLLRSESWELTFALLGAMLNNVLKLRRTTQRRSRAPGSSESSADIATPETILQSLQTLDTLYAEVGLKAVEQDASGALPLLKALLDDNDLLADMEMLDLVLPLVHSAVSRLRVGDLEKDEDKTQVQEEVPKTLVLQSIGLSLEKVHQSIGVPEKQKEFARSLRSMINSMLQH